MLLGGFDGLHIGHRALLSHAKKSGLPVGAMTIVGGKTQGCLFDFSEREEIFRSLGLDFVFELPFQEIKNLSPKEFLALLEKEFSPKQFVCGEDFRFGAGAVGTPGNMKEWTQVRVESLPLVEFDGRKVSASLIKEYLSAGEIEKANALLGSPFFLRGEVIKDRGVGKTLGFPTANIVYPKHKHAVRFGVYETVCVVDGKPYKGVTNYGARPTFDNERVLTETYLDGFDGDLYGKTLRVQFLRFLREVQKFESVDALKAQLREDVRRIREDD